VGLLFFGASTRLRRARQQMVAVRRFKTWTA